MALRSGGRGGRAPVVDAALAAAAAGMGTLEDHRIEEAQVLVAHCGERLAISHPDVQLPWLGAARRSRSVHGRMLGRMQLGRCRGCVHKESRAL